MRSVTADAPAKVNLWLSVGAPGDDGFHPLATVFEALDLRDEVRATRAPSGAGVSLRVEGEGADAVPVDQSNLAWRAAELLAAAIDVQADVDLVVTKRIPVAGGMAGGSADAAAALVACDELWDGRLGGERLGALGAVLGSDVPFCLHGGVAVGLGRGDRLTPVLARGSRQWALALADGGLSTPGVYARLDAMRADGVDSPTVPEALIAALRADDPALLASELGNELQAAAVSLRPELGRLISAGSDAGALAGLVSGSGPTCAFLASDRDHAIDIAARLSGSGLCRSVRVTEGPAPGARVIDRD